MIFIGISGKIADRMHSFLYQWVKITVKSIFSLLEL